MFKVIIITFFFASLGVVGSIFERKGKFMSWIAINWSKTILKVGKIEYNVFGLENIDLKKIYFFAPNHESALDIPLVFAAFPMHVVSIAKIELSRIPIFGWSMLAGGHFFVDRANHNKAIQSLVKAKKSMLNNPRSIFLFPEGTRSKNGKVGKFKKGGILMAIDMELPIVPIGIIGTKKCQDEMRKGKKYGSIDLRIGNPISTKNQKKEGLIEFVDSIRNQVINLKGENVNN